MTCLPNRSTERSISSMAALNGSNRGAARGPVLRGGGTADYFEVSEANLFRMARPG